MQYPKRSQYQYAKSPYQNIDPSRDARQLPSGVMLALGTGNLCSVPEPCNNAGSSWLGEDLKRKVALKVLTPELSAAK